MSHVHRLRTSDRIFFITVNLRRALGQKAGGEGLLIGDYNISYKGAEPELKGEASSGVLVAPFAATPIGEVGGGPVVNPSTGGVQEVLMFVSPKPLERGPFGVGFVGGYTPGHGFVLGAFGHATPEKFAKPTVGGGVYLTLTSASNCVK